MLVGEADTVERTLHVVANMAPNVLLVGRWVGAVCGADVAHAVRQQTPSVGIVMLGDLHAYDEVVRALASGVHAVAREAAAWDDLRPVVAAAARGEYTIHDTVRQDAALTTAVLDQFRVVASHAYFVPLSGRELQVLELMRNGLSNKQIAAHLHLSLTVKKKYVASIGRKLGTSDRTHAVVAAIRHGLITARD